MRTIILALAISAGAFAIARQPVWAASEDVKEAVVDGPDRLAVKVRMEGPYTADAPLQVVCYFRYTPERAKRMSGAPVELDKHLGGVIASLRERGEFVGDDFETLLLVPPPGKIEAKALLLIGLGEESTLSTEKMMQVGRVALREATRLGVRKAAFAPLIRDQGNSALPTGEVARAVVRGVVLARDTESHLAKEALGKGQTLDELVMEAGPKYFDETTAAIREGVKEAGDAINTRPKSAYAAPNR